MQKKILVLVSNPKGRTNLELLPEINQLKEALRRSVNRERFVVEWEVAVRQADLRRHILDVKPQTWVGQGFHIRVFEKELRHIEVVRVMLLNASSGGCGQNPLVANKNDHQPYGGGVSDAHPSPPT